MTKKKLKAKFEKFVRQMCNDDIRGLMTSENNIIWDCEYNCYDTFPVGCNLVSFGWSGFVALDFGGAGEPIAEWDEDTEEFVITENDIAEFRSELMNESDIHAETTYYRLDDEPLDEEIF